MFTFTGGNEFVRMDCKTPGIREDSVSSEVSNREAQFRSLSERDVFVKFVREYVGNLPSGYTDEITFRATPYAMSCKIGSFDGPTVRWFSNAAAWQGNSQFPRKLFRYSD